MAFEINLLRGRHRSKKSTVKTCYHNILPLEVRPRWSYLIYIIIITIAKEKWYSIFGVLHLRFTIV